jgi:hypothetical protein
VSRNDLIVARAGERWGVSAGRELLAVAETKRDARRLAGEAAKILRASGGESKVVVKGERRTFKPD